MGEADAADKQKTAQSPQAWTVLVYTVKAHFILLGIVYHTYPKSQTKSWSPTVLTFAQSDNILCACDQEEPLPWGH